MRIYIDEETAHTANLLPENSFWKDHDSEYDSGHPNQKNVELLARNETENEQYFWDQLKP